MPSRRYSDSEIAATLAVLASNGGNISKTERETGVSAGTISRWVRGEGWAAYAKNLNELQGQAEQHIRVQLDNLAIALLDRCIAQVDELAGNRLFTALGIVLDKYIALKGIESEQATPDLEVKVHYD